MNWPGATTGNTKYVDPIAGSDDRSGAMQGNAQRKMATTISRFHHIQIVSS